VDSATNPKAAFGFLTIVETSEAGLFGGYLALCEAGRPLEFRCTTPVVPSRAQAILYGPTLRPYLVADVIGVALLEKAKIKTSMVLTDDRDYLQLAPLRSETFIHVSRSESSKVEQGATTGHDEAPHAHGECTFTVRQWRLHAESVAVPRPNEIAAQIEPLLGNLDLLEPFDRIRSALAEIQQLAGQHPEDLGETSHVAA